MQKKENLRLAFFIQRTAKDKEGNCPVIGRITIGRSQTQFSTKIRVPDTLWDTRKARLTGKSHIAVKHNRKLDEISVLVHSRYRELKQTTETITAQQVKEAYQGMAVAKETLIESFKDFNIRVEKRVGIDRTERTLEKWQYNLQVLQTYLKEKHKLSDIPFALLDLSFIQNYERYLLIDREMKRSTANNIISSLRTIVNQAVTRGTISVHPFLGYECKRPKAFPRSITADELGQIRNLTFELKSQDTVRDMFVFSCFTGISLIDIIQLTEENIFVKEDNTLWVQGKRQKTGTPYSLLLLPQALEIIEKHKGRKQGFIFDAPKKWTVFDTMKVIEKRIGMTRPLTFHQGRHCFASLVTLSNGVPIESVSRMLGHSDIETTQIYAVVSSEKIEKDMQNVMRKLDGKLHFTP
ncbi:MAG: site-specific integrase [Bacteroidales bacterium]|jgi:site-specific recombinase XerD|nr:site-specific integrase [Bacteroidales bacterium]MDD2771247.1 site-specific integrase [Bacteroidales bacterium]MDD3105096.1 site-specific integrase [Bacteroidales bacterium]MDD3549938.1 site-specific integrase [Bacteroidales bacterium]MDY0182317.1 site-specific integrase [Proteiniphilum sp.]